MGKSNPGHDLNPTATASPQTHANMPAEHRQWIKDNAMWRDDLAIWQQELKRAREGLAALDSALCAHEEALRTHAAAVRGVEQEFGQHEHALAEYERSGKTGELVEFAAKHRQVGERHAQQADAHERTKKHHHAVMARWLALLGAFGAPE